MPTRGEAATAGKREEGEGSGEEGRQLTLVADGVVPEGAGALVLGALQVALPGGGGVLELLVAVIAVVSPQRHPLGSSPLGARPLLILSCSLQAKKFARSIKIPLLIQNKPNPRER